MAEAAKKKTPAQLYAEKQPADRADLWAQWRKLLNRTASELRKAGAPAGEVQQLMIAARTMGGAEAAVRRHLLVKGACCNEHAMFGSCSCS